MARARRGQTIAVELEVRAQRFRRGMKNARTELQALRGAVGGLSGFGGFGGLTAASAAFGAAVGAAAAAGARSFTQLETTMTRLQVLTATNASQAGQLAEQYERIARATGTDVNVVAGAGFFARSAGLGVPQTADFTQAVAQAQRVTGAPADLLGRTAITGATGLGGSPRAILDVLVAADARGQFAPGELGRAFPRGFSAAAAAGLSSGEYAASLAAQSQLGSNAAEGVTRLQQLLESIVNPTTEGRAELNRIGIDPAALRGALDESLTGAVGMLGTGIAKGLDIRKVSGQTGAMAIRDMLTYEREFEGGLEGLVEALENSGGALQRGAEMFEETVAFKFDAAVQEFMSVARMAAGAALPGVTNFLRDVGEFGSDREAYGTMFSIFNPKRGDLVAEGMSKDYKLRQLYSRTGELSRRGHKLDAQAQGHWSGYGSRPWMRTQSAQGVGDLSSSAMVDRARRRQMAEAAAVDRGGFSGFEDADRALLGFAPSLQTARSAADELAISATLAARAMDNYAALTDAIADHQADRAEILSGFVRGWRRGVVTREDAYSSIVQKWKAGGYSDAADAPDTGGGGMPAAPPQVAPYFPFSNQVLADVYVKSVRSVGDQTV